MRKRKKKKKNQKTRSRNLEGIGDAESKDKLLWADIIEISPRVGGVHLNHKSFVLHRH